MVKVGSLVEFFRHDTLIEQARIIKISKVESLEQRHIEYTFQYADGNKHSLKYRNKKWYRLTSPSFLGQNSFYHEEVDLKYVPYKLGFLKQKFKQISYMTYKQRLLFHQGFQSWRNQYYKENGNWPSFSQENSRRIFLKNKLEIT